MMKAYIKAIDSYVNRLTKPRQQESLGDFEIKLNSAH